MYTLRLHNYDYEDDFIVVDSYTEKKQKVLQFIKQNTGKYKGTEIFWYCGLYKQPYDKIMEELEKEGLIKWNRNKQVWNYVSNNRGKSKTWKNKV